jgi:N utilization substance protein A
MVPDLALSLARGGVRTREELAEQSVDELTEVGHIDADRAAKLIMAARAHWFEAAGQN